LFPVPEDLLPLCSEKPEDSFLNKSDSIDEMVRKLKESGRNYNNETFLRLLQLIGRNNIINIDVDKPHISSIATLNNLLETIQDENDEVIEGSFIKKMQSVLNTTFDIASPEITQEVRDLNNYLAYGINSMKEDIVDFIEKNRDISVTTRIVNKTKSIIDKISVWTIDKDENTDEKNYMNSISNDSMYSIVNFYKTFISYFVSVFPNIITNKVDFSNVNVQKYMNLSQNHSYKISESIKKYYEDLNIFYGNVKLNNILGAIQKTAKNIQRLSEYTPCFSSTKYGDLVLKPLFDERTSKMIYEYYFLRILVNYIDLTDDDDMVVVEVDRPTEVQDLFTVDYVEERERRDVVREMTTKDTRGLISGNKRLK
jgi:hypothetical protein